jgi:hypothetical protein
MTSIFISIQLALSAVLLASLAAYAAEPRPGLVAGRSACA